MWRQMTDVVGISVLMGWMIFSRKAIPKDFEATVVVQALASKIEGFGGYVSRYVNRQMSIVDWWYM